MAQTPRSRLRDLANDAKAKTGSKPYSGDRAVYAKFADVASVKPTIKMKAATPKAKNPSDLGVEFTKAEQAKLNALNAEENKLVASYEKLPSEKKFNLTAIQSDLAKKRVAIRRKARMRSSAKEKGASNVGLKPGKGMTVGAETGPEAIAAPQRTRRSRKDEGAGGSKPAKVNIRM